MVIMEGRDNPGFLEEIPEAEVPPYFNNAEMNYHTYVYDANKSLQGMTVEVLPSEKNYMDLSSILNGQRPTLDELAKGRKQMEPVREEEDDKPDVPKLKGKIVKFGWLKGVFMRCLLNIWGVMLFLRLTWVVGQGGLLQGLSCIALCNLVTFLTAISMSAVATNGQIKGGGIYYMISRSLGPEFGGAIGIMFVLANSIAVSMYIIGFCDSLLDMLVEYTDDFRGIVGDVANEEDRLNNIRIIGIITLIFILILAVVGMDWVTRVQMFLLFLLIVSQMDFIIGTFVPKEEEKKYGFLGYSMDVVRQNQQSDFHDNDDPERKLSFFTLFGVFFPAVTGIVAGANLSGDLKDPSSAIPKGTLLAIFVTFLTYIGYGVLVGCSAISQASGDADEYYATINGNLTEGMMAFNNCSAEARRALNLTLCQYGSSNDQQMMVKMSFTGYLIYAGCFAATLSSAIASLVGAPRVLQALSRDKLYPGIHIFAVGHGANNDPFRGYFLVFFITVGCLLIGKLDVVSTLLSNFFVAAYCLINYSVFHASITKSPGWRPTFKYYNKWVSLLATVLCVAVMFLMDWVTALITFFCIFVLYFYINYRRPDANWGSSFQAQQFVSALRNVQLLNEIPEHVKNYRPKILVFTGIPVHRQPLVDFANLLTKKLSLMVCAHVESGNSQFKHIEAMKAESGQWLRDHNVKAFINAVPSKKLDDGAFTIMNAGGIGKLVPNMILLGFKNNWLDDLAGLESYLNILHHGFNMNLAVAILKLKGGCDYSSVIGKQEQIILPGTTIDESRRESFQSTDSGVQSTVTHSFANLVVERGRRTSVAVYHGVNGNPLKQNIVSSITQFQTKKRKGNLDVWWLYDDGGLTLLLPYILTTRAQFSECSLRVFTLANKGEELDRETRNMASLLAKFRIDYSEVTVIPDVTRKAGDDVKSEFNEITDKASVNSADLSANRERTNRHLRLTELLRENSSKSEMIIMTLPMPRQGATPPALYMSWLEIMSRNMPPFLFVRGNQTSVLTFYS